MYYVISATIAIELSILNNFFFNHIWTFGHINNPQPIWKKLIFFEAISSIAVIMQIVTMYLFTEYLHIYYLISLMIAIPITVAWNYLANKHFTWKQ
jgi:dolichol-phosphate mannosyltransferase